MSEWQPLIIDDAPHEGGNARCEECAAGYPKPCVCGGLVHAQIDDGGYTLGEWWIDYRCDRCGFDYERKES